MKVLYLQRSPQLGSSVGEIVQAAAGDRLGDADTVVGDVDHQIVLDRDGDGQLIRVCVTNRVADRLTDDCFRVLGQRRRHDVQRARHSNGRPQPHVGAQFGHGLLHGGAEGGAA